MISAIIRAALDHRFLVWASALFLFVVGLWATRTTPLDAIPDLSDVQVIVFTSYEGQAPQVVEDQVTYPLTTAMLAVPKAQNVRGFSFFGLSFIYIVFEDDTDLYWARARVLEYLNYVSGRLPKNVTPSLGPDATGVGWVFEYALVDKSGRHDLAQLRSVQDWYLRYPLQMVEGVAEVASIGGHVKQYQVEIDPNALAAYGIPISVVRHAIMRSNNNVGGRLIEMSETEYMVRGLGYIQSISDIENIALKADGRGTPIRIKDIADVHIGPELRRGVAELNGKGEVAGGVVVMRYGENALATIDKVKKKLADLSSGLPEGVEIVPVYDRSDLINRAVNNLTKTLIIEFVLVSLICGMFLLHFRSSMVALISLPLGILLAFIAMKVQGINANIMSLGGIAIAIGAMVDGPIVIVENAHKHLAIARSRFGDDLDANQRWSAIKNASVEVGPAVFVSLVVIVVAYFAVFTLEAQEGRLFKPLAFTSSYAMAAAAILAITLVPVLAGVFIRGKVVSEEQNPVIRFVRNLYAPILKFILSARWFVVTIVALLLLATVIPLSKLGSEFMPPLDEGDILYMPTTFPGISITKARELLQQTDKIIASFPEVESVFGKVGRAQTATDPAPLSMIETIARLKPRDEWPDPAKTTKELMQEMDQAIKFPGLANAWTMPIKTRIDMLSTGIKTPVGIKVSGPDLVVLQSIAEEIERAMKTMPETLSAFGDRAAGGYFLDFDIKREALARFGLKVGDVQDVIMSAVGGMKITDTVEGLERYSVNLRYPRELRDDPDRLARVLIPTASGAQIPISQVATIELRRGAPVIKSEGARPNAWVYVDLSTSDVGGFVAKARKIVEELVELPPGYTLIWSGQYEYMKRASDRLRLVIPLTVLLVFVLLYLNFRNIAAPMLVMLSVPFALTGGFWLVYWLGYNLSVAVAVGFIALAGIAIATAVLVLAFIEEAVKLKRLEKEGEQEQGEQVKTLSLEEIHQAVIDGTSQRLRPIIMTATSTIVGLLPIMFLSGTGADVMQRIAAPMIGGMLTTTVLTLLVLPAIYSLVVEYLQEIRS